MIRRTLAPFGLCLQLCAEAKAQAKPTEAPPGLRLEREVSLEVLGSVEADVVLGRWNGRCLEPMARIEPPAHGALPAAIAV